MEYLCYGISISCFVYLIYKGSYDSSCLRVTKHANDLLGDQIDQLKADNDSLKSDNDSLKVQNGSLKADKTSYQNRIVELESCKQGLTIKFDGIVRNFNIQTEEFTKEKERFTKEIRDFQIRIHDLIKELEADKKEIKRLNLIKSELVDINHAYRQKILLAIAGIKSLENLVNDKLKSEVPNG